MLTCPPHPGEAPPADATTSSFGISMTEPPKIFDRRLLRARRGRVAPGAAKHDFLLQRVASDLEERLLIIRRDFPLALNLGAHHGVLTRRLEALEQIGTVITAESAPEFLSGAQGKTLLADEEALPFADASLDLVASGLALQTVNDLPGTLLQIRRALKPDGLFLGALLGGATLTELRQAWLQAESEIAGGASPRVAPFADVRDLGGLLQRAGFALPVVDADTVSVSYASPLALMAEVKAMGASNVLAERRRVPVTRRLLLRAAELYAEQSSLPGGRIHATFEILTLTAWVPHESQPKPLQPGSAKTRLADALGVKEQPISRDD
jgi:NADH dehydrogenase [ubiquinone] 1 alpha subcomplex assembly factor 5